MRCDVRFFFATHYILIQVKSSVKRLDVANMQNKQDDDNWFKDRIFGPSEQNLLDPGAKVAFVFKLDDKKFNVVQANHNVSEDVTEYDMTKIQCEIKLLPIRDIQNFIARETAKKIFTGKLDDMMGYDVRAIDCTDLDVPKFQNILHNRLSDLVAVNTLEFMSETMPNAHVTFPSGMSASSSVLTSNIENALTEHETDSPSAAASAEISEAKKADPNLERIARQDKQIFAMCRLKKINPDRARQVMQLFREETPPTDDIRNSLFAETKEIYSFFTNSLNYVDQDTNLYLLIRGHIRESQRDVEWKYINQSVEGKHEEFGEPFTDWCRTSEGKEFDRWHLVLSKWNKFFIDQKTAFHGASTYVESNGTFVQQAEGSHMQLQLPSLDKMINNVTRIRLYNAADGATVNQGGIDLDQVIGLLKCIGDDQYSEGIKNVMSVVEETDLLGNRLKNFLTDAQISDPRNAAFKRSIQENVAAARKTMNSASPTSLVPEIRKHSAAVIAEFAKLTQFDEAEQRSSFSEQKIKKIQDSARQIDEQRQATAAKIRRTKLVRLTEVMKTEIDKKLPKLNAVTKTPPSVSKESSFEFVEGLRQLSQILNNVKPQTSIEKFITSMNNKTSRKALGSLWGAKDNTVEEIQKSFATTDVDTLKGNVERGVKAIEMSLLKDHANKMVENSYEILQELRKIQNLANDFDCFDQISDAIKNADIAYDTMAGMTDEDKNWQVPVETHKKVSTYFKSFNEAAENGLSAFAKEKLPETPARAPTPEDTEIENEDSDFDELEYDSIDEDSDDNGEEDSDNNSDEDSKVTESNLYYQSRPYETWNTLQRLDCALQHMSTPKDSEEQFGLIAHKEFSKTDPSKILWEIDDSTIQSTKTRLKEACEGQTWKYGGLDRRQIFYIFAVVSTSGQEELLREFKDIRGKKTERRMLEIIRTDNNLETTSGSNLLQRLMDTPGRLVQALVSESDLSDEDFQNVIQEADTNRQDYRKMERAFYRTVANCGEIIAQQCKAMYDKNYDDVDKFVKQCQKWQQVYKLINATEDARVLYDTFGSYVSYAEQKHYECLKELDEDTKSYVQTIDNVFADILEGLKRLEQEKNVETFNKEIEDFQGSVETWDAELTWRVAPFMQAFEKEDNEKEHTKEASPDPVTPAKRVARALSAVINKHRQALNNLNSSASKKVMNVEARIREWTISKRNSDLSGAETKNGDVNPQKDFESLVDSMSTVNLMKEFGSLCGMTNISRLKKGVLKPKIVERMIERMITDDAIQQCKVNAEKRVQKVLKSSQKKRKNTKSQTAASANDNGQSVSLGEVPAAVRRFSRRRNRNATRLLTPQTNLQTGTPSSAITPASNPNAEAGKSNLDPRSGSNDEPEQDNSDGVSESSSPTSRSGAQDSSSSSQINAQVTAMKNGSGSAMSSTTPTNSVEFEESQKQASAKDPQELQKEIKQMRDTIKNIAKNSSFQGDEELETLNTQAQNLPDPNLEEDVQGTYSEMYQKLWEIVGVFVLRLQQKMNDGEVSPQDIKILEHLVRDYNLPFVKKFAKEYEQKTRDSAANNNPSENSNSLSSAETDTELSEGKDDSAEAANNSSSSDDESSSSSSSSDSDTEDHSSSEDDEAFTSAKEFYSADDDGSDDEQEGKNDPLVATLKQSYAASQEVIRVTDIKNEINTLAKEILNLVQGGEKEYGSDKKFATEVKTIKSASEQSQDMESLEEYLEELMKLKETAEQERKESASGESKSLDAAATGTTTPSESKLTYHILELETPTDLEMKEKLRKLYQKALPFEYYKKWCELKSRDPTLTPEKFDSTATKNESYTDKLLGKGKEQVASGINVYSTLEDGTTVAAVAHVDKENDKLMVYNLTAATRREGHGKDLLRHICYKVTERDDVKQRIFENTEIDVQSVTLEPANDKLKEVYKRWATEFENKLQVKEPSEFPVAKGYKEDFRFLNGNNEIAENNPVLMPLLESTTKEPRKVPAGQLYLYTDKAAGTKKIYRWVEKEGGTFELKVDEDGNVIEYTDAQALEEGFFRKKKTSSKKKKSSRRRK